MLYQGIDAAAPPRSIPPGVTWVGGYIGGTRATRIWTLADWLPFARLRQFPIWVPDLGRDDPVAAAIVAAARAHRMGWYDNLTRVIVCDTEDRADRAWYQAWKAQLYRQGYLDANYGSLGSPAAPIVTTNGSARVWAADWDDDPVLEGGQQVHAHQYAADISYGGTLIDKSVMDHDLWLLGGSSPRRSEP